MWRSCTTVHRQKFRSKRVKDLSYDKEASLWAACRVMKESALCCVHGEGPNANAQAG